MRIEKTTLGNGIRVVSQAMPHVETTSISVLFDVGARYETLSEAGITHLLEHMVFKGTRQRSARMIAEEIESVGGVLNAYTSREHTSFYARVLWQDLALVVDILGDILQHSLLAEEELCRERDVIIQEIGQVHDTPDDLIFDQLHQMAFPEQAIGRPVLGTAESVAEFSVTDLRNYLTTHYTTNRMVVAAAGRLDHANFVEMVEEKFTSLPPGRDVEVSRAEYQGGEQRSQKDLEQIHILLGFPGMAFDDPDFYALQAFSTMLGGGMSSRLFQEVREARGLAYSVYSFAASHKDSGLFGIYAGTDPDDVIDLLPVIATEFKGLVQEVSVDELQRSKAQLKAGLVMSLESTSARAEQLARQTLIFGNPLEMEMLLERVECVSEADIKRVSRRLLSGQPTLAAVGRVQSVPDFAVIESLFRLP